MSCVVATYFAYIRVIASFHGTCYWAWDIAVHALCQRSLVSISHATIATKNMMLSPSCLVHCLQVRKVLDTEGGYNIKIIAQIDTCEAVAAYDEILAQADGIMVSRTNLGMSIPAEKVGGWYSCMLNGCPPLHLGLAPPLHVCLC